MKKSVVHRGDLFGYPNLAYSGEESTRIARERKHKSVYEKLNIKDGNDVRNDYKRLSETAFMRGLPTRNKFSYDFTKSEKSQKQVFDDKNEQKSINPDKEKHNYIALYGSYKCYKGDQDSTFGTSDTGKQNPTYGQTPFAITDQGKEGTINIESIQIKENEYCEIENVPSSTQSVIQPELKQTPHDTKGETSINSDLKLKIRLTVKQRILLVVILIGIASLLAVAVVIAIFLSDNSDNKSVLPSSSTTSIKSPLTIQATSDRIETSPRVEIPTTIAASSYDRITTAMPSLPPSLPPLTDVTCNDSSVLEKSGPVDLICIFRSSVSFTSVDITFRNSLNSLKYHIGKIEPDGSVTDLNINDDVVFNFASNILTITVQNATCVRRGFYGVSVEMNAGDKLEAEGKFVILNKPDRPELIENHETIEGEQTWVATCSGKTGYPAGFIRVLLKRTTDVVFSKISEEYLDRQKVNDTGCNNHETVVIRKSLTDDLNNTLIKCVSINNEIVEQDEDMALYTSSEGKIILIEENYCSTKEVFKRHPRGCLYYVQCDVFSGKIFSRNNCPISTPCFNFSGTFCDYCDKVSPPCNNVTVS